MGYMDFFSISFCSTSFSPLELVSEESELPQLSWRFCAALKKSYRKVV